MLFGITLCLAYSEKPLSRWPDLQQVRDLQGGTQYQSEVTIKPLAFPLLVVTAGVVSRTTPAVFLTPIVSNLDYTVLVNDSHLALLGIIITDTTLIYPGN